MAMFSSDVTAGTNATATQYNNLRKDLRTGMAEEQAVADGATITFDLSLGKIFSTTLGNNRILAVSNPPSGGDKAFIVILKQDGTGGRTVTWWSGIKWINATAPVLTTTLSRTDIFAFYYDGTDYYGSIVGQNYG